MRVLLQRVSCCRVLVDDQELSAIRNGLLLFLGVRSDDTAQAIPPLAEKIVHLRVFEDEAQKMNRSVLDVGGAIMVVSQFTLYGGTRKGRRPEFTQAMPSAEAEKLYEQFVEAIRNFGVIVETGTFGAKMDVSFTNHGPVTLLLEHP